MYSHACVRGQCPCGRVQVEDKGDAADKGDKSDEARSDPFPGDLGGSAIQPPGPAPEKPTFGNVVTKDIEDGAEIRRKFAR